jgi:hypothetical protein
MENDGLRLYPCIILFNILISEMHFRHPEG